MTRKAIHAMSTPRSSRQPPTDAQYFDEDPSVPSQPTTVDLYLPDLHLSLQTDRGVFAYGQVDAGTKLLLSRGPSAVESGDVLDIGCGAGPIALTIAKRRPGTTVWAVDINARARDLCVRNAGANGLGNVRVCAPDEVPADLQFAEIWSNPPIRIGKAALHALLLHWLPRLADGAAAHMVVQKHLGSDSLQQWLTALGWPTQRFGSASGYRILTSRRATT
jgi:16S rRNA (guanine1207-N2)-methyltransferase